MTRLQLIINDSASEYKIHRYDPCNMAHTEWVFYSFPSRIVGQATCGIWTMPPGMELVYDPQFDLDDSNDKENFQISFNLVNARN